MISEMLRHEIIFMQWCSAAVLQHQNTSKHCAAAVGSTLQRQVGTLQWQSGHFQWQSTHTAAVWRHLKGVTARQCWRRSLRLESGRLGVGSAAIGRAGCEQSQCGTNQGKMDSMYGYAVLNKQLLSAQFGTRCGVQTAPLHMPPPSGHRVLVVSPNCPPALVVPTGIFIVFCARYPELIQPHRPLLLELVQDCTPPRDELSQEPQAETAANW
jgi:hypothetical protein